MLLLALMAAPGCALNQAGESSYRVRIPTLQAPPIEQACDVEGLGKTTCTCLVTRDHQALVRKLKAACLALGGSPKDCQTEQEDHHDTEQ
jgi:hypothetical protein